MEQDKKTSRADSVGQRADRPSSVQPPKNNNIQDVALDSYGDPLPQGAQRRFGTIRLRHTSSVIGVAFSPDGKILASTSWDGVIRLWDPKTAQPITELTGSVNYGSFAATFSPDGKIWHQ